MKTLLFIGFSVVLSGAVIGNAYYQKKQFYPSVVYITKSNPSMAVRNKLGFMDFLWWRVINVSRFHFPTNMLFFHASLCHCYFFAYCYGTYLVRCVNLAFGWNINVIVNKTIIHVIDGFCFFLFFFAIITQMLYIQAFVMVILMWRLMRKVFFGSLRPAEIEV